MIRVSPPQVGRFGSQFHEVQRALGYRQPTDRSVNRRFFRDDVFMQKPCQLHSGFPDLVDTGIRPQVRQEYGTAIDDRVMLLFNCGFGLIYLECHAGPVA